MSSVEHSVRLVSVTPDMQHMICYCARVSNPSNQENTKSEVKLMRYLAKNRHWSPFEMAHMTVEIVCERSIAAQILRHRSFSFQEFSARYAETQNYIQPHFRMQDHTNRQSSLDTIPEQEQQSMKEQSETAIKACFDLYNTLLKKGVAKECARMVLPMCTATRIYMSGSIRSWIHYIQVRASPDTQLEHQRIAYKIKAILLEQLPCLSEVLQLDSSS